MGDMLLDSIHKLLNFVSKNIIKNKKYRSRLNVTGRKDYLVGVIEFPTLDALMVFKNFAEYVTSDYTFFHNNNLRQSNSTLWSRNSLEIYAKTSTGKVKAFLNFLCQLHLLAESIIGELRSNWVRIADFSFVVYLRRNVHRNNAKQGEDVFWQHVYRHLDVPSNTVRIKHGVTRSNETWNYIMMMTEDQRFIEKGFGIHPCRDARSKEEITTYYHDFRILQQFIDEKLL